ncbi:peptidase S8 [Arthrobacter sp. MYb211]|uniref:S8 family serine peptidase n=1 Tax=unclassified Arthrobacter TaxID=235627 RepID=UPI000CFCC6B4|nr:MULTISPECIES: S8 family serine peptidase [unclassified Arthrobacter]PRA00546.1 peptidase S8 [Arthrobacter sp. MYb224]PRA04739.1 peptidase S8 [Arthrobacter sp. MYb229]PRA08176.1 peptidase S8 [Arthrobacter sp. MYb221]PRB51347.1 peptidase S8 [Arthrobacter sp. MYb216]PRC02143.1 peptidase S8 [Arthrobacter sp. MYb211]
MFTPEVPFLRSSATPIPGRYVLVFDSAEQTETESVGIRALSEDVPQILESEGYGLTEYFPRLGIAVVSSAAEHLNEFQARCASRSMPTRVVPEMVYHALSAEPTAQPTDSFNDTDQATWGLQAVAAVDSKFTGAGIKVAVLDTGFDLAHPDFAGRTVVSKSFVPGEDAQDGHGHGTHCIGSSCGPRTLADGRGYGVASGADIYAGKVLGADGSGSDATILAGIDWALENECQVISMSLGADVQQVHPPYVTAGRRALELGSLIIAAAGNNAQRSQGNAGFVGAPANSPYVMAVGALDNTLNIADFSARTLPGRGGQVDISGPGVAVYSSWPGAERYNTISGTSMATPHVAGIAALLAEATGFRARELWAELVQEAQRLELFSVDVGSGLTQAPPPAEA